MKTKALHARTERGVVRIHPPYDIDELDGLLLQWREAREELDRQPDPSERDNTFEERVVEAAEQDLREYLALELTRESAREFGAELFGSGVA